jgi:hypothetical protein
MEQLIPASLMEEYSINTKTPLMTAPLFSGAAQEVLMEVPDTDEAVRAALQMVGVKPMICQEKGKKENKDFIENKKRLQKVADEAVRKLIFVGSGEVKKPGVKPVAKSAAAKKGKTAPKVDGTETHAAKVEEAAHAKA